MANLRAAVVLLASLAPSACAFPSLPAKLPPPPYVAVMSGQMPAPIDQVARHSWIVLQRVGQPPRRFELGGGGHSDDPFDDFASGDVMLHGVVQGDDAEIGEIEKCLEDADRAYYEAHPDYFPIPGPNSNTFVAYLDRTCHLYVELPATAIGRDYVGIVGADVTEGRTGIQLGSIPVGLRIGLREGVGVQIFGLPLGLHLVPPGIDVPVNPGRIGFQSDEHIERHSHERQQDPFPERASVNGAASVTVYAAGFGSVRPLFARGLEGAGYGGLSARVVYGKRVGFAGGLDFEMGATSPVHFAGGVHLYPVGVGVVISQTGFVGLFGGIGASGMTSLFPSALELPVELRAEFDLGPYARIGLFARESFNALEQARQWGVTGLGEGTLGIRARFGDSWGFDDRGAYGSGYFFGFEQREIGHSSMVGFLFGTEIDAGYSAERELR
ncbi:MAG: DUF3750 domain-containing protein [Polyangiaceae bacterium]